MARPLTAIWKADIHSAWQIADDGNTRTLEASGSNIEVMLALSFLLLKPVQTRSLLLLGSSQRKLMPSAPMGRCSSQHGPLERFRWATTPRHCNQRGCKHLVAVNAHRDCPSPACCATAW